MANERKEKIAHGRAARTPRLAQVLNFLEREVWPNIPRKDRGRPMTKTEREQILGYRQSDV